MKKIFLIFISIVTLLLCACSEQSKFPYYTGCYKCGTQCDISASFCTYCGVLLKKNGIPCSLCEGINSEDSYYCQYCGTSIVSFDTPVTESGAMTHEEYIAAALDSEVIVETYVQAHQSWRENKITVYCQSPDGAYFLYQLACSEEDAAKLVPGTKIRVTGTKSEWAGEVEVMNGTFEFVEGADTYIAKAFDATALLGTEELIAHQNEFVTFKGLTVDAIEYKNGEPGDDIYLTLSKDGTAFSFCVEVYLTGKDSEVYTTVGELVAGDVVDVEGFLYWYEGVNTHITAIAKVS